MPSILCCGAAGAGYFGALAGRRRAAGGCLGVLALGHAAGLGRRRRGRGRTGGRCRVSRRRGGTGRRRRRFRAGPAGAALLLDGAHLVEYAALPLGRQRGSLLGGSGRHVEVQLALVAVARQQRQSEAGGEEQGGEDRGGPRQHVGLAAPGHETAAPAHAQRAAFGTLQQNHHDEGDDDQEVDDDEDGLHDVAEIRKRRAQTVARWTREAGVLGERGSFRNACGRAVLAGAGST